MTQYRLVYRDESTLVCSDDMLAASSAALQLLEKNNTITDLLCHSPNTMIGSISSIHQIGHTVEKNVFLTRKIALVGFENMLHINLTPPPSLTYVSSASEETRLQATDLMIRKLKKPKLQTRRITLSGQLITRESA